MHDHLVDQRTGRRHSSYNTLAVIVSDELRDRSFRPSLVSFSLLPSFLPSNQHIHQPILTDDPSSSTSTPAHSNHFLSCLPFLSVQPPPIPLLELNPSIHPPTPPRDPPRRERQGMLRWRLCSLLFSFPSPPPPFTCSPSSTPSLLLSPSPRHLSQTLIWDSPRNPYLAVGIPLVLGTASGALVHGTTRGRFFCSLLLLLPHRLDSSSHLSFVPCCFAPMARQVTSGTAPSVPLATTLPRRPTPSSGLLCVFLPTFSQDLIVTDPRCGDPDPSYTSPFHLSRTYSSTLSLVSDRTSLPRTSRLLPLPAPSADPLTVRLVSPPTRA